jgi:chromosome segregation ATPase
MLEKFRDCLTDLNSIGHEISLLPSEDLNEHTKHIDMLQNRLGELLPTAQFLDLAMNRTTIYIQRDTEPAQLGERIAKLQQILHERQVTVKELVHLKTVAPTINKVNDALDTKLGQLEQCEVETLKNQQSMLDDLQNSQHQLEQTLAELPPGKEADELRQRSEWNLSRLKDWLKRLSDAVGDRLAALAAFNATRDQITQRMVELQDQNKSDNSNESGIENRIKQLMELRATLTSATSNQLEEQSIKEAEVLQQEIDHAIANFQVFILSSIYIRKNDGLLFRNHWPTQIDCARKRFQKHSSPKVYNKQMTALKN